MADEDLQQAKQAMNKKAAAQMKNVKKMESVTNKKQTDNSKVAEQAQATEESKKGEASGSEPKKSFVEKAKEKVADVKAGAKKEEKKEAKVEVEREYVVPLRRKWLKVPKYKRANKAVKALKEFIAQHMKVYDRDLRKVKIDILLNNELRFRGMKKPPAKIKVKAIRYDDGTVKVNLVDIPKHIEFEIARKARKASEKAKKAEAAPKPAEQAPTTEESVEEKEKQDEAKKEESKEKKDVKKLEKKGTAKPDKHMATKQAKAPVTQRKALQK
jgi:large subunit ribosomal protein L31e